MAQSHREVAQRLFELAHEQQDFFNAKQAKAAGFAENKHPYHVHAGNWIREHRGVYRLLQFPTSGRRDLVVWALWSRNRRGDVEGVYSHQTALRIHELSNLNPAKLHMTVPKRFRRTSTVPAVLVQHYADLSDGDVELAQGFKVIHPLRTILDPIAAGTVEHTFILQSLSQAVGRGLVTRHQIRGTPLSDAARKTVEGLLRSVA